MLGADQKESGEARTPHLISMCSNDEDDNKDNKDNDNEIKNDKKVKNNENNNS